MTYGPTPTPFAAPVAGTKIYLKRTQTLNNTPVSGDIEHGELWMNYHSSSPRLYFKDNANNIVEIKPGPASGEGASPPLTGNEIGDLWFDGTNLLVWNGSSWQVVGVSTLAALDDTDVAGATQNQLLAYDGAKWVAVSAGSIAVDVNLGYTPSATQGVVTNDAGSDATIPARSDTNAGLMLPADKTAIDGLPADFDFLRAGDDVSDLNNDAGYITAADIPAGVENLGDLGDVTTTGAQVSQILKYNGTNWYPANPAAADISGSELNDLGDVQVPAPSDGDVLYWNNGASQWQSQQPFSGSYNDLTDQPSIPDKTSDLTNDGNGAGNPFATTDQLFSGDYGDLSNTPTIPGALNDLSDVDATPTAGQHLAWDDGNKKWIAEDPPAVGGGGTVTSVEAGDGLATDGANPITGAGTIKAVAANATITVTAGGIAVTPGQYLPADGGQLTGSLTALEQTITSLEFDLSKGPFWLVPSAIDVPNPTNAVAGMSGLIRFEAPPDSWGFNFKFPGGTPVQPSALPAVAPFYVKATDEIYVGTAVQEII